MRPFVTTHWYLGPVAALVGLIACSTLRSFHRDVSIPEWQRQAAERVYAMAARQDYRALANSGLVDREAVEYLRLQDHLFGRIKSWKKTYRYSDSRISTTRDGNV